MKKILSLVLILVLMLGMASCGGLEDPAPTTGGTSVGGDTPTDPGTNKPTGPQPTAPTQPLPDDTDGVIEVGVEKLPCTEMELYEKLFDPNSKITVDIQMSDAELQKMQQDYERYRDMGS
jgi:hypothetical protein